MPILEERVEVEMERALVRCMRFGLALVLGASGLVTASCGSGSDEGVLSGVQAIVFAQRGFIDQETGDHVLGGEGRIFDYLRYQPGENSGLFVLEPPTPDGTLRNLTADFEAVDISGLDVSFDAQQVVFSMRHAGDERYHLYVANVDGSGVRQLTFGPAQDVKPLFVPGDKIAFVTNEPYTAMGTRADEYNHTRVVSQIATVTVAGGDADRRLCGQNLSHTTDPMLMSDGRIGYSRWEHFNNRNDVKFFAMNPDCTNMMAIAGEFGKPFNSFTQVQELSPGRFLGVASSRTGSFQGGALYTADANSQTSADPNRLDVQQARFEIVTRGIPTGMDTRPPNGLGRYRSPYPLNSEGKILASWAQEVSFINETTGNYPRWEIVAFDPNTQTREPVRFDENHALLYAKPLVARDIPPVLGDTVGAGYDPGTPSVLGSVDITQTSLDETVRGGTLDGMSLSAALGEATKMRIIEGFSAEIGAVREFGLTMSEGGAIVGEVPVYSDGSWEAEVPSYLPYHLQPIDDYGLAVRNQRLWIQAMPGEERRCGGCHASRSDNVLPRNGTTTIAQQTGPIDAVAGIRERVELAWDDAEYSNNAHNDMQALFDTKCASCHDGGASDPYAGRSYMIEYTNDDGEVLTSTIPYLQLDSTPITTVFEMDSVTYPASYVTLVGPSAMMGDITATGDVPPQWVRIADARRSRLIEVVDAESETNPGTFAFHGPGDLPHPEDVGGSLTREERLMLIRSIDLGAQYYSRQNVPGAGELVDRWEAP